MKKNLLISSLIALALIGVFIVTRQKPAPVTEQEAEKLISTSFGEEIKKIENKSLVISHTKRYITLVVGDQYIILDTTKNPAKIFQYTSTKPPIDVKVLEIKGSEILIEHDDHTHWISNEGYEDVKVGDIIIIKDPHTYVN